MRKITNYNSFCRDYLGVSESEVPGFIVRNKKHHRQAYCPIWNPPLGENEHRENKGRCSSYVWHRRL